MYKLIVGLLQPYVLLHLVLGIALLWLWRTRRLKGWSLAALVVPWAGLLVVSLNPCGYVLLGSLEWSYPPRNEWPSDAQAIVVLSGDLASPDAVRRRAEPGPSTTARCLHAAEVYRQAGARPIVVSGGKPRSDTPGPSCAVVMRELLLHLGVSEGDILMENFARSTYENAVESRKLLAERGLTKVILVTDAMHMRRSERCFRKQGIEVVPSPCNHRATELRPPLYFHLFPNPYAVQNCHLALHEWLGTAWYALHGRI